MSKIKDLFRRSPFEPLRHHLGAVLKCVDLVKPMFQAVRGGRRDELEAPAKKVFKLEHKTDLIKDEIRQTIPKRGMSGSSRRNWEGDTLVGQRLTYFILAIQALIPFRNRWHSAAAQCARPGASGADTYAGIQPAVSRAAGT